MPPSDREPRDGQSDRRTSDRYDRNRRYDRDRQGTPPSEQRQRSDSAGSSSPEPRREETVSPQPANGNVDSGRAAWQSSESANKADGRDGFLDSFIKKLLGIDH